MKLNNENFKHKHLQNWLYVNENNIRGVTPKKISKYRESSPRCIVLLNLTQNNIITNGLSITMTSLYPD
jgi:hypothetical protein